jgi:hypothetical protein
VTAAGLPTSAAAIPSIGHAVAGHDVVSVQFNQVVYSAQSAAPSSGPAWSRPRLPVNFVHRRVIADAKAGIADFRTSVLLGPTGMGKSVGAASILQSASANSLWLDGPTFDPSEDVCSADLIVLDNLSIGHPVFTTHWLRALPSQLVVTTTSPEAAFQVLSDRGLANTKKPIVEFGGFTETESKQFLDQALGDLLSDDEKQAIAIKLRGSPMGLQALPDLLLGKKIETPWYESILKFLGILSSRSIRPVDAFLPDNRKLDVEGVASVIMPQWIEQFRSPEAELLLRILCRTSTLGMGPDTLAFVADSTTAKVVTNRLASAVDKGFVRRAVNHRFPDVELLVPHDVLRGYFLGLPANDGDRRANERYIDYLKARPAMDPASQVDAIIAGMQNAFDRATGYDSFQDRFDRFASMLQKVLVEENLPSVQIERIARLFESKLSVEQVNSCSILISLSHAVGFLPPSNLLAEIIWPGSRCSDAWGRGASIRAAVHHWKETGRTDIGISHVNRWLDHYLSRPDRPHHDPFSGEDEDDVAVDLDIAAAAGGLCALGQPEAALDRLETAWTVRQREHSRCTIAHHAVLIGLADANRKDLLFRSLDQFWKDIPDEPHKLYVQIYLQSKGILVPEPSPVEIEESPFAATVARAAHSEPFWLFIRARQPGAQAYL